MQETVERVLAQINRERLVRMAMGLVDVPSPTGHEEPAARFVQEHLTAHGVRSFLQMVEPGRANVVGELKGTGGGASLMFNSHLDTSFTGTDADLPVLGELSAAGRPSAYMEDDRICGLGINNDKGPMAAFVEAAIALKESGIELRGDLILAGVAGEVGRAGFDDRQGPETRSKGVGTRALLSRGVLSDYALVAEPSNFTVSWCLPGALYLRLTTRGRPLYTPYTQRTADPNDSENAVIRMTRVIAAVEAWGAIFEAENRYEFAAGTIIPKVNIGAIEGGLGTKPNYQPAICRLYVDVRTPPNRLPLDVQRELEDFLRAQGLGEVVVEAFLSERGYDGQGYEPLAAAVRSAHHSVTGKPIERISESYTSMWNDVNIYHERGIPSLKYGPPTIRYGQRREESLSVDHLVQAARVYAHTALQICNQERPRRAGAR